jgi:hypothetical protein
MWIFLEEIIFVKQKRQVTAKNTHPRAQNLRKTTAKTFLAGNKLVTSPAIPSLFLQKLGSQPEIPADHFSTKQLKTLIINVDYFEFLNESQL